MDAEDSGREVLRLTDDYFPHSIADPKAMTSDELALAGLARARRLLWGMIELDGPGSDLVGMLARALFETWTTWMFLLLEGDSAIEILDNNDQHEVRRLAKRIVSHLDKESAEALGAADLFAQSQAFIAQAPDNSGTRLDTAAMAERIDKILAEQGREAGFGLRAYTFLYGPESYTSTHGGIGAAKQYVVPSIDQPEAISAGPWLHEGEEHRLALCVAMVLSLASHLAPRLGFDVDALDRFATHAFPNPTTRDHYSG